MLVPSEQSSARRIIDTWLGLQGIASHVVGEFDDSSLRESMASAGLGVCFAPVMLAAELNRTYGLKPLGTISGPEALYFAVSRSAAAMPLQPLTGVPAGRPARRGSRAGGTAPPARP
jgi:DNA-binding transcriptional LysR family regulator